MLSIRLQRLGRKGYPVYRVVVQDSRQSPDSGKYVALLGNYNPHTKDLNLDKPKAEFYLKNGAQPSDRIISLFKTEKVDLPDWVKDPSKQERKLKNPDKLRKNRPAEAEAPAEEPAEAATESPEAETPSEEAVAEPAEQAENTESAEAEEAKAPEAETSSEEAKPAESGEEVASEEPNAEETTEDDK